MPPFANTSALESFRPLFHPRSIAVVGASASSVSGGNRFIRHLKAFGYQGRILPVHPSAERIEDLPAIRSLADLDEPVDYAYVAVAADAVPGVLASGRGKLRVAQVMSSGFGEIDGGQAMEDRLVAAAREAGIRVVGPNCLGVHSPRARVTFTERTGPEPGRIGIVCQSGGLGIDILRRGRGRGLRFSGLVTVGNCADVSAAEIVQYFAESDDTDVIGLYVEGVRDGRRLFETLRANSTKPVVILKGGRTDQGRAAAASHTGSLVGSDHAWVALARQTGAVLADTLDAFLDTLLVFQCLTPAAVPTRRVVLFGNGGGTSVLGSDAFSRAGFDVPRLPDDIVAALTALELPAGSSVRNPIDTPAGALQKDEGRLFPRILDVVGGSGALDALVVHINMTVVLSFRHVDMLGNLVDAALRAKADGFAPHLALVLRSDGEPDVEEKKRDYRARAVAAGIPIFDELASAAASLAGLRLVEAFRAGLDGQIGGRTVSRRSAAP
ncbi:acyl-CoA synthetase [Azospirillum thiophilum]|uniref:Acyl-CoA synthetase n=1 Tax=Azospirillum thiophilum TaxID=528244 RepID=A0AAC8ZVV8_9PROT|nr:CoA-binding protein [Azospirillum thiophilum]ALG74485.1 acyl-CoA synthetase [Azospirillum thiophilum]KJR63977.1 acyl-CoA synthetase [Azospirillum thiophilum]